MTYMTCLLLSPPMTDEARNTAFAAYLEELAAGRASRELSRVTRANRAYVNPTTIADMRWGTVPTFKLLDRFARGLALEPAQRDRLFQLAGFSDEARSPVDRI